MVIAFYQKYFYALNYKIYYMLLGYKKYIVEHIIPYINKKLNY